MAKIIIVGDNKNVGRTATLDGGSWSTLLPLTNMQKRPLSRKARSTDADSDNTWFTLDFGDRTIIQMLSIIAHNITNVSARIRIRLSNTAGATSSVIYDTGKIEILTPVYDWMTNDFYAPNWFYGELLPDDRLSELAQFLHIMPEPVVARYARIDIYDAGNDDGYIEIGYLWVSPIYQPTYDIRIGSTLGHIDNTEVQQAVSGVEYYDSQTMIKTLTFTISGLGKNEALSNINNTVRLNGISGLVYVIPDYDDPLNVIKNAVFGRLAQIPDIQHYVNNAYEVNFSVMGII